jgi:serine/threonine protein kinase
MVQDLGLGLPGKRVPVDSVRLYLAELVQALEFLHGQNIIFMDVKLENLLVCERGHIQLADFGLASYSDSESQPTMIGTPSYLSPELILGTMNHDRTMDVWACGIVAYELLCGFHPFDDSGSAKQLFHSVMEDTIHFPAGVRAHADAIDVIRGFLTKEPSVRLGGSGWKDVKAHPFFAPLSWNHVYDLAYDPLLKPPADTGLASPTEQTAYQSTALDRLSRDFKSFVSPTSPHTSPCSSGPPSPFSSRRKHSYQYTTGTGTAVAALELSRSKIRHGSPRNGAWQKTLPLAAISNSSLMGRRLHSANNSHRAAIAKEILTNFHLKEATNNAEQLYRTLEIIPARCAFAKLSLSPRKFLWCCPSFVSMMGGARVVDTDPSDFCLESDRKKLELVLSKAFVECEFSDDIVLTLKPPLVNHTAPSIVVRVTMKRRSADDFKAALLWRQYRLSDE